MRTTLTLLPLVLLIGCGPGRPSLPNNNSSNNNSSNNNNNNTNSNPMNMNISGCDPSSASQSGDLDGDGYTPAQGDCNDCNPSINPGAIQIPGDTTDYACNGMAGVVTGCDDAVSGMRDATSLAHAMDLCDSRFLMSATFVGPSDQRARKAVSTFGVLAPKTGHAMTLMSNGIAADKSDPDFDPSVEENPGTKLGGDSSNSYTNPAPGLPGAAGCSQSQPSTVYDYTELVLTLKAPTNANSFSFDFQFFSGEYPVFVCTEFNDEFLVLQESSGFPTPTNIAFDMQNNAVTVNSGFFTTCTNDATKPQTQHCTTPVSGISGTGFDDPPTDWQQAQFAGAPPDYNNPGGSTGWLTTTSPVKPGEMVTLHFIIFDEGDHVLDSASIVDNFRWGTSVVTAPSTTPIL